MKQADCLYELKKKLTTGAIAALYANTYYSLTDRILEDGMIPESLTGGYGRIEFCRTIGGMYAFLSETGQYPLAERTLRFVMDSARRCGLARIPHIAFAYTPGQPQQFSTDDQVDTSMHVLRAWALMAQSGHASADFVSRDYAFVRHLVNVIVDQPYLYYEPNVPSEEYPHMFPPERLCLIYNCAVEHSRENRRWSAFDLLTQCYGGGMLEAMISVARQQQDEASAVHWTQRLEILRDGIARHMTRTVDGRTVYLEMRLPDGGWGRPFLGMGWLNLAPIPAGWDPLPTSVLDNTMAVLRPRLWTDAPHTQGKRYMQQEFDEAGNACPALLGKAIGWDIAYCLRTEDYARILEWLGFLEETNTAPLLAEAFCPTEAGWNLADPGNGEQCTWWCWSMAKLRKTVGLPATPAREEQHFPL